MLVRFVLIMVVLITGGALSRQLQHCGRTLLDRDGLQLLREGECFEERIQR